MPRRYPCNCHRAAPCPPVATSVGVPIDRRSYPTVSMPWRYRRPMPQETSPRPPRTVDVDNPPQILSLPQVVGGEAWRRTNDFTVSWTNPADAAPRNCPRTLEAVRQRQGAVLPRPSRWRRHPRVAGLPCPTPGSIALHVWLEDAAGNAREESGAIAAALRFDPEPPQLAFEPIDPADPLRVVVSAVDRHSGVAAGEIEMRAAGTTTWHGLANGARRLAARRACRRRALPKWRRTSSAPVPSTKPETKRQPVGGATDQQQRFDCPRASTRGLRSAYRARSYAGGSAPSGPEGTSGGVFDGWIAASLRGTAGQFGSAGSSQTPMANQSTARRSRRWNKRGRTARWSHRASRRPAPTGSSTTSCKAAGTATLALPLRRVSTNWIGDRPISPCWCLPDTSIRARPTTPPEWPAGACSADT